MELEALVAIKSGAPDYSPLQEDWQGDPERWKRRLVRNDASEIVEL